MAEVDPVSKAEVRARVRAARRVRSADERVRAAAALADHVAVLLPTSPSAVSAYLSLPTEPGTDALISVASAAGHVVRAPRIEGRELRWVPLLPGDATTPGPMGIREPLGDGDGSGALQGMAVLFLPGLAVDGDGHRLGQGGGFYDRALSGVATHAEGGPLRVIVLFEDEVLDTVPFEAHDCLVDVALTPAGPIRLGR